MNILRPSISLHCRSLIGCLSLVSLAGCDATFSLHGLLLSLDRGPVPNMVHVRDAAEPYAAELNPAEPYAAEIDRDGGFGRFTLSLPVESYASGDKISLVTPSAGPWEYWHGMYLRMEIELHAPPRAGDVIELPTVFLWRFLPLSLDDNGIGWTEPPSSFEGAVDYALRAINEQTHVYEAAATHPRAPLLEPWLWEDFHGTQELVAKLVEPEAPFTQVEYVNTADRPEGVEIPGSRGAPCVTHDDSSGSESFEHCPLTNGSLVPSLLTETVVVDLRFVAEIRRVVVRGARPSASAQVGTVFASIDGERWDEVGGYVSESPLDRMPVYVVDFDPIEAQFVRLVTDGRADLAEVSVF